MAIYFFRILMIALACISCSCISDDASNESPQTSSQSDSNLTKPKKEKAFINIRIEPPAPDQCDFVDRVQSKEIAGIEFIAKVEQGVDVSLWAKETVLLEDNVGNIFRKLQGRSSIDTTESVLLYRGEVDSKRVEVKNGTVELQREGECIYQVSLFIEVFSSPKG